MSFKEFIREFNVTLEELYYEHDHFWTHATRTLIPLPPSSNCLMLESLLMLFFSSSCSFFLVFCSFYRKVIKCTHNDFFNFFTLLFFSFLFIIFLHPSLLLVTKSINGAKLSTMRRISYSLIQWMMMEMMTMMLE